ncbi:MAG: hypothetical protein OCC45_06060 [Desulfotalea sp.]
MKFFKLIACYIFIIFFAIPSLTSAGETKNWPRKVKVQSGSITIYQPQIESFKDTKLSARAAVAYKAGDKNEPIFGVSWFTARTQIDRGKRTVNYDQFKITEIRFPKENKKIEQEFKHAVANGFQEWNLSSSLEDLTTALAAINEEQQVNEGLKNEPPKIIYKDRPAILVYIDGKAVLQDVEKTPYQAVANTPYPLFFNKNDKTWYLNAASDVWYKAGDVDGPYLFSNTIPKDLIALMSKNTQGAKTTNDDYKIDKTNAPLVVISHQPTELVVSSGEAEFQPLTDKLLTIKNSDTDVFLDLDSQEYYLIISGRWYKAKRMIGNWTYVPSDQLPSAIVNIPKDSEYSDARSYIAGTDEAKEAVIDAQIPQTATVTRGIVDIDVSYDGDAEFKKISDTSLSFATNSNETVILSDNSYYLVKDGVWYISSASSGPWQVSDHAPENIKDVPPSSPVYNTKYVYVYDSTPDVVYVGYTPGYVGSYIYGPTIVYGTGWYYRPYISPRVYYPRPATWGFAVTYNPYTGWGFGVSWSRGPFHLGFYSGGGYHRYHHRGYWGPRGYHSSFNNTEININRNININDSFKNNFNNFDRKNNLYRNKDQRAKIKNSVNSRQLNDLNKKKFQKKLTNSKKQNELKNKLNNKSFNEDGFQRDKYNNAKDKISANDMRTKASNISRDNAKKLNNYKDRSNYQVSKERNNVLADKKGNIYRNDNGKWQQRVGNDWKNQQPKNYDKQKIKSQVSQTKTNSGYTKKQNFNSNQAKQRVAQKKSRSGYERKSNIERQNHSRQRASQRSRDFSRQKRTPQRSSGKQRASRRG